MKAAREKGVSSCPVLLLPLVMLLLLLVCCALHTVPCAAYEYGSGRSYRLPGKSKFSSSPHPPPSRMMTNSGRVVQGGSEGKGGADDEELYGAQKRRVYTGPNPLHNR
ncbi:hypothetical protein SAY87_017678 [Trapa incisa]|uniref:Uncharacterized protein n=2 Tax=Trapa TaxID=22665 RepID=A0AAN7QYM1_TRANT|nr:hypothetical protein SAY87_017678 [Trapa incisa]KAK4784699.1 hypothetical protein SAY86_019067 [Trapa natans]